MKKIYLLFVFIVLVDCLLAYQAITLGKSHLYNENNLLENTQVALLLMSIMVFLCAIFKAEKSHRVIFFAGALFFLTLFLRELDFEDFDIPLIFIFITSGDGRNMILLTLWLIVFLVICKRFSYYKKLLFNLSLSRTGFLFFLGGLVLLTGDFFDEYYELKFHKFYEELLETNGYFLIFMATLATPAYLKSIRSKST